MLKTSPRHWHFPRFVKLDIFALQANSRFSSARRKIRRLYKAVQFPHSCMYSLGSGGLPSPASQTLKLRFFFALFLCFGDFDSNSFHWWACWLLGPTLPPTWFPRTCYHLTHICFFLHHTFIPPACAYWVLLPKTKERMAMCLSSRFLFSQDLCPKSGLRLLDFCSENLIPLGHGFKIPKDFRLFKPLWRRYPLAPLTLNAKPQTFLLSMGLCTLGQCILRGLVWGIPVTVYSSLGCLT